MHHDISASGRRAGALALSLLLALSSMASAGETTDARWYGSLGLGWNYAEPLQLENIGGTIDFDLGFPAASVAVGMNAFEGWRFEVEVSRQEDAPEVLYFKGTDIEFDTPQSDNMTATSLLFDVYRDFQLGIALRPYLGLGAGPAKVSLTYNAVDNNVNEEDITTIVDDSNWTFAYQAIVGLSLPLSRRLALGIEYRLWQAPSINLDDAAGNHIDSRQTIQSGWLRLNYQPGGYAWNPQTLARHPAVDARGFYLSASAGAGISPDRDFLGRPGQFDAFAIGPMASMAMGYRLNRRWRFELEAARRTNRMQIFDTLYEEFRTSGDVNADSVAVNAIFQFAPEAAINPLVGIGVGQARVSYDLELATNGTSLVDDSDRATMVQMLLGVDIAVTPRWTATIDYRLWLSDRFELEFENGDRYRTDHMIHSMAFGIRYSLARQG